MTKFKVAQFVILNDKRRARVMCEVEPRRYLVQVFGGGTEVHAAGDLAIPGEDAAIDIRENARWRSGEGGLNNGRGGYLSTPHDSDKDFDGA